MSKSDHKVGRNNGKGQDLGDLALSVVIGWGTGIRTPTT